MKMSLNSSYHRPVWDNRSLPTHTADTTMTGPALVVMETLKQTFSRPWRSLPQSKKLKSIRAATFSGCGFHVTVWKCIELWELRECQSVRLRVPERERGARGEGGGGAGQEKWHTDNFQMQLSPVNQPWDKLWCNFPRVGQFGCRSKRRLAAPCFAGANTIKELL